MSLINDALRKARREAAEKEAEARGAVYSPPRAHVPPERRSGTWIGVAVGLLLALVGVGFGWYLSRGDAPVPVAEAVVDAPVAEAPVRPIEAEPTRSEPLDAAPREVLTPAPDLVAPEPAPPTPSAPPATLPVEQARPRRVEPPPPPQPPSPVEPAAVEVASVDPEPAASVASAEADRARPIREPERTGRVEPDVYVLEADVDGSTLELDFIIYSDRAPFAQINGQQVSPGQMVDDWAVVSVERERVLLRKGPRDVVLRVR